MSHRGIGGGAGLPDGILHVGERQQRRERISESGHDGNASGAREGCAKARGNGKIRTRTDAAASNRRAGGSTRRAPGPTDPSQPRRPGH
ncbi:hypothetical protein Ais01nite_34680 [Asanoa ishikariensis]|nr:hypothetical protein Ais01nite_34680 [Asanoa ishikariensis]